MKKYLYSLMAASCMIAVLPSCKEKAGNEKFVVLQNMDTTIKPGDNFYLYVNGGWLKTAEIPASDTRIGAFNDLRNSNKVYLRDIAEDAAKGKKPAGSIEQKVGDFYASGMDSAAIEKLGYEPVKPALAQIDAITDVKGLLKFVAQQQTESRNLLFSFGVGADEKNSVKNIAVFNQGGLGMPNRDYYFKTDAANQAIIKAYQVYMQKLYTLTGDDAATADKKVAVVFALEKDIAATHRTNVELRDPQSNYNKFAVANLQKQMPAIDWTTLLNDLNIKTDSLNVGQPAFYAKLNQLLTTVPLDTWKAYLRFHVLDNAANALSNDFVVAKFEYSGKALSGQKEMKPRWERMVSNTDRNLGEALGQLYVKKYFTEDAKKRMHDLVNNLGVAFENRINHLDWMSDATKAKSKDKLHSFLKKIGYPEKWRDYNNVTIDKAKYYENLVSCGKNEYAYQTSKVGKSVDRSEWGMTPPTINAYYNPTFNEIVFPAGILQFPFFDPKADDAINYGGIGMVIGHEMTHGFDDQGAQYDKDGNLNNWWDKNDEAKFKVKSKQVIDLYNSFTVLDTVHVNGSLTTGENIADFGGIAIAYDAFKMTAQGKGNEKIDGLTPDQRFFISVAQIWRDKTKEETQLFYINTDPHSPAIYRVNAPLQHFAPFYAAFNIQEGDKMYVAEDKRIKIW